MKLNIINYIKANGLIWLYIVVVLFWIGAFIDNSRAGYIISSALLSIAVVFTLGTFFSYINQQEND